MGKKRKQYSPESNSKVAFAAIRNEETGDELTPEFKTHPTMTNNSSRAHLNGAVELFDKGQKAKKNHSATVDKLCKMIGQMKVGNDFLSKGIGL